MKTVWIVLGILAVLGLACCGGVLLFGKGIFNAVASANDDADRYSKQVFERVAAEWDVAVLSAEGSPEFKEQVPQEDLKKMFELLKSKLGKFKSVGEFSATNTQAKTTNGDSMIVVTTNASAIFEKAPGQVTMEVIKRGETWKVLSFEVKSDALKSP